MKEGNGLTRIALIFTKGLPAARERRERKRFLTADEGMMDADEGKEGRIFNHKKQRERRRKNSV